MRTVVVFCFLFCQLAPAQENLNTKLKTILAEYPDKSAVEMLKNDIGSGMTKVSLDQTNEHFRVEDWQSILMRFIVGQSNERAVVLPKDFFQLSACQQKIIVEAVGLVYHYLAYLEPGQTATLVFFSDSKNDTDVTDEQRKDLGKIMDGFEKLALENTERFAELLFDVCQPMEINSIFPNYGEANSSVKTWSELTQKNITEQFKEFRSFLEQ